MTTNFDDTIAALATAPGRSGVGIIRVSGAKSLEIFKTITKKSPKPRYAHYLPFVDKTNQIIDTGLAIFFPGPNSFTGEDVVEFQGHGGPVVLDILMSEILNLGVRSAIPGEFSQRAFINDKMDLTQAEAIADLIDASSEQAARCAMRSLQGDFSKQIHQLVEQLIQLRIYVEASIDFPEEEIDFLSDGKVEAQTQSILNALEDLLAKANQGILMREGMSVAIVGQPNAGKSSLLNALSGRSSAIVTDIAGTTRDVLKEEINIDGMPLHIIDTAGLRDSDCEVEKIGIDRAWEVINNADKILFLIDSYQGEQEDDLALLDKLPKNISVLKIFNKIDKTDFEAKLETKLEKKDEQNTLYISAKQGLGIDLLRQYLKDFMGYQQSTEGVFSARRRHLDALNLALSHVEDGMFQLQQFRAGELLAEELNQAQLALSEITGEFDSDDLLGRIFSGFCIGK